MSEVIGDCCCGECTEETIGNCKFVNNPCCEGILLPKIMCIRLANPVNMFKFLIVGDNGRGWHPLIFGGFVDSDDTNETWCLWYNPDHFPTGQGLFFFTLTDDGINHCSLTTLYGTPDDFIITGDWGHVLTLICKTNKTTGVKRWSLNVPMHSPLDTPVDKTVNFDDIEVACSGPMYVSQTVHLHSDFCQIEGHFDFQLWEPIGEFCDECDPSMP